MSDTVLWATAALLVIAAVCGLIGWWGLRQESRFHRYEPEDPETGD